MHVWRSRNSRRGCVSCDGTPTGFDLDASRSQPQALRLLDHLSGLAPRAKVGPQVRLGGDSVRSFRYASLEHPIHAGRGKCLHDRSLRSKGPHSGHSDRIIGEGVDKLSADDRREGYQPEGGGGELEIAD